MLSLFYGQLGNYSVVDISQDKFPWKKTTGYMNADLDIILSLSSKDHRVKWFALLMNSFRKYITHYISEETKEPNVLGWQSK